MSGWDSNTPIFKADIGIDLGEHIETNTTNTDLDDKNRLDLNVDAFDLLGLEEKQIVEETGEEQFAKKIIQEENEALKDLCEDLEGLKEVSKDLGLMVYEQKEGVEKVEENVEQVQEEVEQANVELSLALKEKVKGHKRKGAVVGAGTGAAVGAGIGIVLGPVGIATLGVAGAAAGAAIGTGIGRLSQKVIDNSVDRGLIEAEKREKWVPDDQVQDCPQCQKKFKPLYRRKHHCRICGMIFCSACSSHFVSYTFKNLENARDCRACDACFKKQQQAC